MHPHASILSALVSEDSVALALAVTDGSLEAYIKYDRAHHGRNATDVLSNSIVVACILAEPLCTLGVSDCDQLGLDEYASGLSADGSGYEGKHAHG